MRVQKSMMSIAIVAMLTMTAVRGQPSEPEASGLTPMDYIQIEQLVVSYAYALDSGSNNGYDYADLFAADGVFVGMNQGTQGRSYRGRDALAALARGGPRGPAYVSHFITNMKIEPTPQGAKGRQYAAIVGIGENRQPSEITHGGFYEDVYVKTPDGWRFQSRAFYASESGPNPKQLQTSPSEAPLGSAAEGIE
jgi:hypothetical protein